MRAQDLRGKRGDRPTLAVAAAVTLQALAAAFFLADAIGDLRSDGVTAHLAIEGPVALALVAGVVVGAWQLRTMLADAERRNAALATASGALADVIRARFRQWAFTASESDVALFALKGCDVRQIAAFRNAAPGTVRAQLARVYAKAGVNSRAGLLSLFIDDLLDLPGIPRGERDASTWIAGGPL